MVKYVYKMLWKILMKQCFKIEVKVISGEFSHICNCSGIVYEIPACSVNIESKHILGAVRVSDDLHACRIS